MHATRTLNSLRLEPTLTETKMGLNTKDIQFRLSRVLHIFAEISYTFMRKHPLVSSVLLVFFIIYIFLSYIYNLLVFLFPFFVCIAIFIRIFWSSEKNQHEEEEKKGKQKRVEIKSPPKMFRNERRGLLYKCPSQNATSRRRNFTGKKLEVYGGIEIKAKNLSSVFRNEFTMTNKIRRAKLYEEDVSISSLEAPTKQTFLSEPLMLDLVTRGDELEKKIENKVDVKKSQDDDNKSVELKEDDQKNEMDLGTCELERHKRLESLIARRKARKQLKLLIANALIDMKSVIPSQIAPLFVTRINPLDSPKEFDGIQMPGSAPSSLRSPFDIPYDPFEEKPDLTGDSFDQELKDLLIDPGQEDHEARGHTLAHSRDKKLQGKGNNNLLEKLLRKEAIENESKASILSSEEKETTHEENEKCKIGKMVVTIGEEVDNAQATKSMPDHATELDLIPKTDVDKTEVSEKPEESIVPKLEVNIPISSANATKINDSLYESLSPPVDKKQETMFTGGPIHHTPSCSLASDLQVEVSEIGSPTLTADENHETTTTTDGESIIYDGDIDKDVTSGSEDMWGASIHSRELRRANEQDISEINSWRDISSPLSLQNIDEENAADVSSMDSRSDIPDDTPTYTMSNDHNNIFGNVKDFVIKPSHSSVVTARWKRLMRLMDNRANHSPHEMHSKKPRELFNIPENSSKAQIINNGNNSTTSEQDNIHNLRSNEETGLLDSNMQQKVIASINSSSSSSPRSVLSITQKTITNQVPSSTYNQETKLEVQQSNMRDVAQEILNGEGSVDSTPQNIQPIMEDTNIESHKIDLNHPQVENCPLENSIQESNIYSKMNDAEVCNMEDGNKLKNNENGEYKLTPLIIPEMMSSEDISEESREIFDDRVPLISLILESSLKSPGEDEENPLALVRQEETTKSCTSAETSDTSSDEDFEKKRSDLNENRGMFSHNSEDVNYLQSESKQVVEDHIEKGKLDKGDASKDSPSPITTEITNFEDPKTENDKTTNNEATDQELDKNEIMVMFEHAKESDQGRNIEHMKDLEVTNSEAPDKELNKNENMVIFEPATESDQKKDIAHMKDIEVTNNEDTKGQHEKMHKNEATYQELNNNENVVLSEPVSKHDQEKNITNVKDLKVTNFEDVGGEYDKMNKNEETTDHELNKNETTIMSGLVGESDQVRKIAHMEDLKVPNSENTERERERICHNEVTSQELDKNETIIISETTKENDQVRNITHMNNIEVTNSEDTEVTNYEDTEGERDKMNKNETMIISDPIGESDHIRNIADIKDAEQRTPT